MNSKKKGNRRPATRKGKAKKRHARNTGRRTTMGITDIFKGGNKQAPQQDANKKPEPKKAKHEEAPPEPELSPELLAMSPEERAKHMAPKKEEEAAAPIPDTAKSQVLAPPTASMTSVGMGSKVRIVQEVNLLELINNMDKFHAEIMALKEIKFQSDEKAKQISEGLGELRAMVFQRDAVYKENDAKLGKMEVIVKEIQPQVIMAAIQKREKEVNEVRARIEKNDSILQVTVEQIRNMQKELEHVRGVARVLEADKKITEIIPRIEESKSAMERLSAKSERLYFEIDKRLSEFAVFKEKVVTIEQLTRELMKMADESKVKLDGCGSKDEVTSLRAEVGKLGAGLEAVKKQVESLRASGTIVTPNALASMPFAPPATTQVGGSGTAEGATSIEALRAQKEEIKAVLSMLEDEYREGVISEKTFAEARMKNEAHLKELEHMIDEKQNNKAPAAAEQKKPEQKEASPPANDKETPPGQAKSGEPAQKQQQQQQKEEKNKEQPEEPKPTIPPEEERIIEPPPALEEKKASRSLEPPQQQQQQQHQFILDESLSDLEEILSLINNTGKIRKQKRDLEKMLETVKKQHAKGLVSDDSYYNIVKSTTEQIENRDGMLKRVSNLPLILSLSKKELMHLKHRKLELESLMKMLEHQLSDGMIAEKTYNDTRFSTTRRLDEIQAKMSVLSKIIETAQEAEGGNKTEPQTKSKNDENKPVKK